MIQVRNSEQAEKAITEPLSPELVLVDPELATLARKGLRAVGTSPSSARQEVAPDERADARTTREAYDEGPASWFDLSAISADDVDTDSSVASRGGRGGLVVLIAALVGVAAAAAVTSIRLQDVDDAGGGFVGRVPESVQAPARTTAETSRNQRASERSRARPGTASPRRSRPIAQKRSTKPIVQQKKRLRPRPPAAPRTRVFVWPAVSRATFYKVEFFRRGRKIFEASPTTARIELPIRWVYRGRRLRLTPGTYRWDVRPVFGPRSRPRYGALITRSNWIAR
jgi:hypothetical protein